MPEYSEVRTFAIDRVHDISLLEERFTPTDEVPDEAFPHSLGVHSGPPERVQIAFDPAVAAYVRSREWHPSQTIADADDGGVVLTLDVCIDRALRSWILSFGGAARALSPPALARRHRGTVRRSESEVRIMTREEKTAEIAKHAEKTFISAVFARSAVKPMAFSPAWVLTCSLSLSLSTDAFAATKAIRAGAVIDPAGRAIANAVILIEGDRITSISTAAPPAGVEIIDLRRFTAIPASSTPHAHDVPLGSESGHPAAESAAPPAWLTTELCRRPTRSRPSRPASRLCAIWARRAAPTT